MAFDKKKLRTLAAMLGDVPFDERRELVERAMLIAGGSFTFDDMPNVTIDERGTWGDPDQRPWNADGTWGQNPSVK